MDITAKAEAFLADLETLYVKHGLSLSHEDGHGSFIIQNGVPQHARNLKWVRNARLDIEAFKPLDPKDIEPVDYTQCQADVPNGHTPFTLGGVPGRVRCKNKPEYLLTEYKVGRDGFQGSMSACKNCSREYFLRFGAGKAEAKPLVPPPDPNAVPALCQSSTMSPSGDPAPCTLAPTVWVTLWAENDGAGKSIAVCERCCDQLIHLGDVDSLDVEPIAQ